jgi:hypothetical protein
MDATAVIAVPAANLCWKNAQDEKKYWKRRVHRINRGQNNRSLLLLLLLLLLWLAVW